MRSSRSLRTWISIAASEASVSTSRARGSAFDRTRIDGGWCELATDSQQRFVERALRRKKLFLALSIVGMVIAVVLAAYYGFRRLNDPTFPIGSHAVIVVLILLNSRQNLRQYRFASFIEDYTKKGG